MFRMYASNSHSYTHLILALGIVREPTVWVFITSNVLAHMTLAGLLMGPCLDALVSTRCSAPSSTRCGRSRPPRARCRTPRAPGQNIVYTKGLHPSRKHGTGALGFLVLGFPRFCTRVLCVLSLNYRVHAGTHDQRAWGHVLDLAPPQCDPHRAANVVPIRAAGGSAALTAAARLPKTAGLLCII